jgi:hypothetical protein
MIDWGDIQAKLQDAKMASFGLRSDDRVYQVGDQLTRSHDWDMIHDRPSKALLDGTCALADHLWLLDGILDDADDAQTLETIYHQASIYGCSHHYLIGGDGSSEGQDDHEVIIHGAKVLVVID